MASKNQFLRKKFRNIAVFTNKNVFQQSRANASMPGFDHSQPVPNTKKRKEEAKKEPEEH